jgi:hypothetical protein
MNGVPGWLPVFGTGTVIGSFCEQFWFRRCLLYDPVPAAVLYSQCRKAYVCANSMPPGESLRPDYSTTIPTFYGVTPPKSQPRTPVQMAAVVEVPMRTVRLAHGQ